jgi:hypothetical protein
MQLINLLEFNYFKALSRYKYKSNYIKIPYNVLTFTLRVSSYISYILSLLIALLYY